MTAPTRRAAVTAMTFATGVVIADNYYAQPLEAAIATTFHAPSAAVGAVLTVVVAAQILVPFAAHAAREGEQGKTISRLARHPHRQLVMGPCTDDRVVGEGEVALATGVVAGLHAEAGVRAERCGLARGR